MGGNQGRGSLLILALMTAVTLVLVWGGCISNQGSFNNMEFKGYVMSLSDSTAVPGALVMIDRIFDKAKLGNVRTDGNGYYEYTITLPTGNWDPLKFKLIVADMDGDTNGVFVSQDTILYDDNIEHELNITFHADFYVQMLEDTTALL